MIVLSQKEFDGLRDCIAMIGAHLSDYRLREGASGEAVRQAVCEVARAQALIRKHTPAVCEQALERPNYFFQRSARLK